MANIVDSACTVLTPIRSLLSEYPERAHLLVGEDPALVSVTSKQRLLFSCDKGHPSQMSYVGNRVRSWKKGLSGCSVCAGQTVEVGINDIATVYPLWAHTLVDDDPRTISVRSKREILFSCDAGHASRRSTVSNRTKAWDKGISGCAICAGQEVDPGVTDLLTMYPAWVHQVVGVDPRTVSFRSSRRLLFECGLCHEVRSTLTYVRTASWAKGNSGCRRCAGLEVNPGINDIHTLYPQWEHLLADTDPRTVTPKSKRRILFSCDRGHAPRLAAINDRTKSWDIGRSGCPICSGREVDTGVNDIRTLYPQWAHLLVDVDPGTVAAKSRRKLLFSCDMGHEAKLSVVGNRTACWDKGNSGCGECQESGYNSGKPGALYLIYNEERDLFKIGVSNIVGQRLAKHRLLGFATVVGIRNFEDGKEAHLLEQRIKGLVCKRSRGDGIADRFDGYTEAWAGDQFSCKSLDELVAMVLALPQ